MNDNVISDRIGKLRSIMKREGVSMYMIPDSDYHNSEYVGEYFMCREYMSGFTGSNGILIVTADEAALWTDGRYFIQAARELEGSGINLMKMGEPGVPKIEEYIREHINSGETFGIDGRIINAKDGLKYESIIKKQGGSIRADLDLVNEIWEDRPAMSAKPLIVLPDDVSGEDVKSKLARVREKMKEKECKSFVLSKLDDIMWLMNIRGGDVDYTPVALSYVYLTGDEAYLFIQERSLTAEAAGHFDRSGVKVKPYDSFIGFLAGQDPCSDGAVLFDPGETNYAVYQVIKDSAKKNAKAGTDGDGINDLMVEAPNPTEGMEAVRNEVQRKLTAEYYIKDSAALTRFLYQIKKEVSAGAVINEYEAAMKLDAMRAKIPGFMDLSFTTISAYGANAAMMHYEATEDSNSELKPEGMYLVDSGAQYMGATTDVTRTIALGPVTKEMIKSYTLVCIGMLRLADAVFLDGCTGRNLDVLARGELWKRGIDYKCGTGHGVGYILGVHTGPQNIRPRFREGLREVPLKPGMTVSDEPGVYIEDGFGIRIENIIEVTKRFENGDGTFYGFEHLTWVPLDPELIDVSYMEPSDIRLYNAYQKGVRERLGEYMESEEELKWLENVTRSIGI